MQLQVFSNHNSVANAVASPIVDRIKTFAPTQSHKFVLGLPTDGTLIPVYGELVRRCRARKVSFEHVMTVNLDECVGLGSQDSQSYYAFMERHYSSLFTSGYSAYPSPSSSWYPSSRFHYQICLRCIRSPYHFAWWYRPLVNWHWLGPEITQAKKRFFDANEQVPSQAVSMGIGTILKAGEIMMLVNRELKSEGLRRALEDGVDHLCPASALQLHENASIFADEDAVSRLQTSTIKYLIAQTQESTIQKHTGELCNGACRKMGWKIITDFSSV
ncbi:uncharacterized protein L203_100586 [Cryptococcus depauperatus CBS 7841]|uniref:Glucosamine-6-phosphate deaminase n=1 Tax=Cryptococcus depauperatus CBS 7841 TaxID=1295531 RepID=A0AAJ8LXH9_9TREE